ncbi:MFS transporter [Actinomadura soli]|uniref:MFS transporter n=1 Tax=Actinomadura soli TaxID=2508997 RepID=A0A5C4J411_9ACTN|nr:MFS transporter [Actinomadura soli]TMQ91583.1 MFS transporter [Actinomadura soli]
MSENDNRDGPSPDIRAPRGDGGAAGPDPRRWLALTVLLTAGFMDLLDVTIVNVTIPTIMRDLDAEYAQVEWVIAAYVLGFAALLVTGGRLGDSYGRRRLFLVGVAGFTLASALCGLATGPEMLIGSRFLQGAMSGLMVPQILAIIHVAFSSEERGKALGIWGGTLGSASATGLVAGALLLDWNPGGLEWRSIFLVNIPIGVLSLVAGWYLVPESTSPAPPKLDLVGVLLSIAAILMLVYPLTEGRSLGWPPWSFGLMGGSVVLLAVFVLYERWRTRTKGSPVMELGLFRVGAFSVGLVVWLVFWIALGGFFLVWTLYMQVGLAWTPTRAGLTALAFAVGGASGSGLSVQVFTPRFGRRVLMAGALLNALGFGAYAIIAQERGIGIESWQMVGPLLAAGFGFGLVVAPMIDGILTGVPRGDAGSASGVLSTAQQVGMALGVALVGILFFGRLDHDSARGVEDVTPALRAELAATGMPAQAQQGVLDGFRTCVRERSAATDPTAIPASCRPPEAAANPQMRELLTRYGEQANGHNFSRTFSYTLWYGSGMLVVVFLGVFALPRQVKTWELDDALAPAAPAPSESSASRR